MVIGGCQGLFENKLREIFCSDKEERRTMCGHPSWCDDVSPCHDDMISVLVSGLVWSHGHRVVHVVVLL